MFVAECLTILLLLGIGSCIGVRGCDEAEAEREKATKERIEAEQKAARELEYIRQEREKAERERAERERAERERAERERAERERAERERAERERVLREQAKRERLAAEQKRKNSLRDYASTLDSRIWQAGYTLNAVIGNRKKSIDKLRNEIKLFERNPDEDGNVKRLVAELNSVVSMRDRFVEELEKAYLLSRDSTPDKENSAKLLESRERLLRLAKEIETLF